MDLNAYSPQIIIGACVAVAVVMLIILWGVMRQKNHRRTAELRARFGPEYDIAVRQYGSRSKAEDALESRLRRVETMQVRSLTAQERSRYLRDWDAIQARFVDHPRGAVTEADELIASVLQVRGYTGSRFEQRVADMTVYHPRLADPYRRANNIAVHAANNDASTEELREALILYRGVLEDLLQTKTPVLQTAQAA